MNHGIVALTSTSSSGALDVRRCGIVPDFDAPEKHPDLPRRDVEFCGQIFDAYALMDAKRVYPALTGDRNKVMLTATGLDEFVDLVARLNESAIIAQEAGRKVSQPVFVAKTGDGRERSFRTALDRLSGYTNWQIQIRFPAGLNNGLGYELSIILP